jgi:hypothetical protein
VSFKHTPNVSSELRLFEILQDTAGNLGKVDEEEQAVIDKLSRIGNDDSHV